MFRVLRGMAYKPVGAARPVSDAVWRAFRRPDEVLDPGFIPRYLAIDSALYQSLFGEQSIMSLGLDLSKSAAEAVAEGFGTGIWYVLLVVLLGALYFVQQRMVAARASISPTMSAGQQKLMQYLPVFFAIFQIFFLAALVVYYIFQTIFRILQQAYITRAFYGHDESLGRQAQRAGDAAREEAKKNPDGGGGGFFAQAKARSRGPGTRRQGHQQGREQERQQYQEASDIRQGRQGCQGLHVGLGSDEQAGDAAEEPPDAVVGREGPPDTDSPRGPGQQGQGQEVVATESPEEIVVTVGASALGHIAAERDNHHGVGRNHREDHRSGARSGAGSTRRRRRRG